MTSEKIYFDSCIFVSYIHKKHKFNEEVTQCLSVMEKLDLEAFYSHWTIIEGERVLIKDYNYSPEQAKQKFLSIIEKSKLKKIPIKLIGLDRSSNANDIFYLIRQLRLSTDINLADSIHGLMMSQNNLKTILTLDDDFSSLKEIVVIKPKQVIIMKPKFKQKSIIKKEK